MALSLALALAAALEALAPYDCVAELEPLALPAPRPAVPLAEG